jgi:hypothetical protein
VKTITKVVFTPRRKIYVSCKKVEYFVETNPDALSEMDFSKEFDFANEKFKRENKNYQYYGPPAATRIELLCLM